MTTLPVNPHRDDIRWSPRVPKWKLNRLYEAASQGIWDDELIDDVGLTLYLRCRDILNIHRAQEERQVTCPCCQREGRTTLIARENGARDLPLCCPICGWQITWFAYRKTYRRHQLNPGGAVPFFREFITAFDRARTPKERMMAIDRVIHQFHYSLRDEPDRPTRAVGVNLIVGNLEDVVQFLDELSGLSLPSELQATYVEWRTKHESTYWPSFLRQQKNK